MLLHHVPKPAGLRGTQAASPRVLPPPEKPGLRHGAQIACGSEAACSGSEETLYNEVKITERLSFQPPEGGHGIALDLPELLPSMLLNYSPALDPGPAPGSQEWALWRGGKDAVRIPQNQTAVKVQEDKRSRSTRVGLWKMREVGTGGAGRRRKQSDIPAPGRERERERKVRKSYCFQKHHSLPAAPTLQGRGALGPWSPAGMQEGVCIHPCFCFRALCPAGYKQRKSRLPVRRKKRQERGSG